MTFTQIYTLRTKFLAFYSDCAILTVRYNRKEREGQIIWNYDGTRKKRSI